MDKGKIIMDKVSILNEIRSLEKAFAFPNLSKNKIKDNLKELIGKNKKIGATIKEGDNYCLITYDGEKYNSIILSDINVDDLLHTTSQEFIFDNLHEKLNIFLDSPYSNHKKLLGINVSDKDKYSFSFVPKGSNLNCSKNTKIVAISYRYPTYFDLNMFIGDKFLTFRNRDDKKSFIHSGDENYTFNNKDLLLHTLEPKRDIVDEYFSVFITGYNNRPLINFREHDPIVLLIDNDNYNVHIIEFPLDICSVGEKNCLGIVFHAKYFNNSFIINVPSITKTSTESAPNFSILTKNTIKNSIPNFDSYISDNESKKFSNEEDDSMNKLLKRMKELSDKKSEVSVEDVKISDLNEGNKIIYIEAGFDEEIKYDKNFPLGYFYIKFKSCIEFYDKYKKKICENIQKDVFLPCFPGPYLSGSPLVLLSNTLSNDTNLHEFLDKSMTICFVSDKMTSNARDTAGHYRLDCIFIIIPEEGPGNKKIKDWLYSINKNAISAMAGPKSTILVNWENKFYFLEGYLINGFIESFECGKEIDFTKLKDYCEKVECLKNPLVDLRNYKLEINGLEFTNEKIIDYLENINIEDISKFKVEIINLLSQISRLYNAKEVENFIQKTIPLLNKKMDTKNSKKLFSEYRQKI